MLALLSQSTIQPEIIRGYCNERILLLLCVSWLFWSLCPQWELCCVFWINFVKRSTIGNGKIPGWSSSISNGLGHPNGPSIWGLLKHSKWNRHPTPAVHFLNKDWRGQRNDTAEIYVTDQDWKNKGKGISVPSVCKLKLFNSLAKCNCTVSTYHAARSR